MKFGLIGTFDVENYGDCMFPELYAYLIKKRFGEVELNLYSPTSRSANILSFGTVHALPKNENPNSMKVFKSDNLILIGGETIGCGHGSGTYNFPRRTFSAYLRLWLTPILARQSPNLQPTFFAVHGVGAVKITSEESQVIARCLSAADRVRFRDEFSSNLISGAGIKFPVDIDPMFLIDHLCNRADWKSRAEKNLPEPIGLDGYIAAQVSIGYVKGDLASWVNSIAQISQRYNLPVLLLPICHFMEDELIMRHLVPAFKALGIDAYVAGGLRNVKDTAALISGSAGFIGSSLHGAVTAVAFAKPLAVLGHSLDGKHVGTLRSVGLQGLVTTKSEKLPDCFSHSFALDREAAREHAQALAEASINALFSALETSVSEAEVNFLEDGVLEIIDMDRSTNVFTEMKRIALRSIQSTPSLSKVYKKWRMWKQLRRVSASRFK